MSVRKVKSLQAGLALLGAGFFAALACSTAAPALAASDTARQLLDFSFSKLAVNFYKPTSDQVLLDGAVSGLRNEIKQHGGDANKIPALHQGSSLNADIDALDAELRLADRQFGAQIGDRQLAYAAIKGLLASVHDRWTAFLDPKEYKSLNEGLDGGNFPGIGVVIDIDAVSKALLVVQTLEGGPAQKAGLQPGDIVLTVDGQSTKGLSIAQDSKLVRGKPGSKVTLSVMRPGNAQPLTMSIVREFIHTPSILARILNGNVGYVRVLVFGMTTGRELSSALDRLQKEGAKGVVLDLRNNGGGYLNAAIDVSSKFVAEGPIVSIDSRTNPLTTIDAENNAIAPKPLAVLVNGFTASASEITSGAIQDSGAGVLIGTRTFGKGVVQTIYPLPDGSALKITTARYLTPSGRDINSVGIAPDIVVSDTKQADIGNVAADGQLQRALAYVTQQIGAAPAAPASRTTP